MSNQLQTEMSPNGHTLNDLIHSNARVAFDQGVKTEQNRILRALADAGYRAAWELIKGEEK